MVREIITLQCGQCGNQIGTELWQQLCAEHGIGLDGVPHSAAEIGDRKEVFFYENDASEYVPRAILIDLEPRVIHSIQRGPLSRLFSPENIYVHPEGGGAGNNWGAGYDAAESVSAKIFDMINREAENTENFDGFALMHSIAGGTGSGLGSYILENLRDSFPKKLIQTYSVFPLQGTSGESDVIVQPYNSVLTMQRLIQHADATIVLDNSAITRIAADQLRLETPTIDQMNSIVARVIAMTTLTMRFPSGPCTSLDGLLAPLIPVPQCHFLSAGYTPMAIRTATAVVQKTSPYDVLRRLLMPGNMLTNTPANAGCYIGALAILQGDVDPYEMHHALSRIRPKLPQFAPWSARTIQLLLAQSNPHVQQSNRVSGLMMANQTSIASVFARLCRQYDVLYKRGVFLDSYRKHSLFADGMEELVNCRAEVESVVQEYKACESADYVQL
ncbi:gamma-tubulin [Perkinsela sp. CCAP 1560/4]|nr:gamma-tubulin [Perkinsela sp. CCAP 1560/4]|eukprot:KNH07418.1 gamma-tubulin [Perkinsela sp. CCAP 1560/4]